MNIGFVGLGAMGAGIVPRLMAAGHAVTGWNRSRDKAEPLIKAGMQLCSHAARSGRRRGYRVLDRDRCGRSEVSGARRRRHHCRACKPGGVYIDMSTIAPDASRAIAAEFARQGLTMLDGPISGSPVTLAQGNASVMVAGDKAAFERAEPVLRAIGPKVTYIGASGLAVK